MSEAATLPKDARGILITAGPEALRAYVEAAEPLVVEVPTEQNPAAPFGWNITHAADTWTKDPGEIAALSDAPIIEGLLRQREVGCVVGAAKTAKTWLALNLGLTVARGTPFLGMKTHPCKVLYLDYELKEGTFRKRMSMLSSEKPDGFFYQCLRGAEQLPSVDDIADLVESEGFGLVIVDSLYRTGWLAEENSNDAVARDLTPLQEFTSRVPCSLLCVDHTAKGGGNERSAVDAARGASAKGGFYDALLVLRSTDKGPDPAGTYAILDPVLRDWPRMGALPLVSFSWAATRATVEAIGTVAPAEKDTERAQVLDAIATAGTAIGRSVIANACKISDKRVKRALDALISDGKVIESGDPSHSQRKLYRPTNMGVEPHLNPPIQPICV